MRYRFGFGVVGLLGRRSSTTRATVVGLQDPSPLLRAQQARTAGPDPDPNGRRCVAHQDCERGEVCSHGICRPGDLDDDRVPDPDDNCLGVSNPDQADGDDDGAGNACDPRPGQFDYRMSSGGFVPAGGMQTGPSVRGWTAAGAMRPGASMTNTRFMISGGHVTPADDEAQAEGVSP